MAETTELDELATWVPELTFAARLALVRQRMGWNIKEAAAACGLPAQSWRGWEVHGREPHRLVTVCMAIAARTGVDFLWLVHGPDRGAHQPTREYEYARLVATVGNQADRPRLARPIAQRAGRPVRQTRPLVRPVGSLVSVNA